MAESFQRILRVVSRSPTASSRGHCMAREQSYRAMMVKSLANVAMLGDSSGGPDSGQDYALTRLCMAVDM